MSDAGHHDTSILLPEAQMALFSRDNSSIEAANALLADWRFARVNVTAQEGDVETAIQTYASQPSPELLVIQTDTIDEGFTDKLEELAGNCDEGTSAIIIGPENDVNLYRSLIDMGVSDYLVRPVDAATLSEVVAKALIEKKGVSGSRLVAIVGAKGGVGASIIAEGLACASADILKQKTVLLDAAGGWSTLGVGLGFEPSTTLAEAVKAAETDNEDNLNRMFEQLGERLSVLATGGDVMLDSTVSAAQLETLIDMLLVKSPIVFVDLSNSPETLQKIVLSRANEILMVTTPTLPALRLARSLLHEIEEVRGGDEDGVTRLLVNMQGMAPAHEVAKKDIEAAVGHKVDAFLPFAPKAFLGSETASKKLTDDKEARALIEQHVLQLLSEMLDVHGASGTAAQPAKGGFLGGLLGKSA